MNICPVCFTDLPDDNKCCGWEWKDPEMPMCNFKLDFLTKESDRKSYSYFSSLKLSPVKCWAFLFGKNQRYL